MTVMKYHYGLRYQVDPYLGINDELQVYVKPHTEVRFHYSLADNEEAAAMLAESKQKIFESNAIILDMIVQSLSRFTEVMCY